MNSKLVSISEFNTFLCEREFLQNYIYLVSFVEKHMILH